MEGIVQGVNRIRKKIPVKSWKTFFKDCDIVMSAPHIFFYSGEHAVLKGVPAVIQTMELRVYVGIEQDSRKPWLQIYQYDQDNDTISEIMKPEIDSDDPNEITIKQLYSFIEGQYSESAASIDCEKIKKQITKMSIRVLSNIYPGSGANWSGAFSTALAGAIYYLFICQDDENEITATIDSWQDYKTGYIGSETNSAFNDINLMAFYIESVCHGGSASGYGTLGAVVGHSDPMIYKTRPRNRNGLGNHLRINLFSENGTLYPKNKTEIIEILKSACLLRLDDIDGRLKQHFHIWVVDTKKKKDKGTAGAIKKILKEVENDVDEALKTTRKLYKENCSDFLFNGDVLQENSFQTITRWRCLDYAVITFLYYFRGFLVDNVPDLDKRPKIIKYCNAISRLLLGLGLDWNEFAQYRILLFKDENITHKTTAMKLSGGGTAGVCVILSEGGYLTSEKLMKLLNINESDIFFDNHSGNTDLKRNGLRLDSINRSNGLSIEEFFMAIYRLILE